MMTTMELPFDFFMKPKSAAFLLNRKITVKIFFLRLLKASIFVTLNSLQGLTTHWFYYLPAVETVS